MERGGSAVKGLVYAILLVAPVWAVVIWLLCRS